MDQSKPDISGEDELRACYVHREHQIPQCVVDIDRFSKWARLQRTMAYVHRFINNYRYKCQNTGPLIQSELQRRENSGFRMVQWQTFPEEMAVLSTNRLQSSYQKRSLDKSSSIFKITPMLENMSSA